MSIEDEIHNIKTEVENMHDMLKSIVEGLLLIASRNDERFHNPCRTCTSDAINQICPFSRYCQYGRQSDVSKSYVR